jgi:hypothetical protein
VCYSYLGRAIAQAVSPRLPTAAARVRAQIRSYGICCGQSGIGVGLLRVLRFPLPILIPPTVPHSSSSIIRDWYNRPNSGRRTKWTQSHPTPRNSSYLRRTLCQCLDYTAPNIEYGMADEWQWIWKEAVVVYSSYCPIICLQGLKNTTGVPAEIQTQNIPNTSRGFRLRHPAQWPIKEWSLALPRPQWRRGVNIVTWLSVTIRGLDW